MLVKDFDYELPEERIAKFPPEKRGETRLLVLNKKTGEVRDSYYKNLVDFLNPGDVLILNDTRVMQSRLFCELEDGRKRELVVLEKHGDEPQRVMYRGKLHEGDKVFIKTEGAKNGTVQDIVITKILGNGIAEVKSDVPLSELAESYGSVPLPPYLHRDATESDKERYQTVWAKNMGSSAAPTASLNMTAELLEKLQQKGVIVKYLTLHVGLGTFLPIRTDKIEDHKMHSEWFSIPEDTLKAINSAKERHSRVIAVGTTVARTLEYFAKTKKASGEDDIFIYPGFKFKIVDVLLTNFHAPKSTVLMLASAFAGWDNLKNAYEYAIDNDYNFLSYGDSMLIC